MVMRSLRAVAAATVHGAGLVRWTHSLRPLNITLHRAPPPSPSYKVLEVEYANGDKFLFSAEFLRVRSPSADSTRSTASGSSRVISGRRHVHILDIEAVGNYGIRIKYDDTHDTGIYTWKYLHELGRKKFYYMRAYIKVLREQGLTRNPRRKK
ncbi:hypothetical protein AXG93_436s1340 [Marchantia polymorpha subsp. ruderalis]|uniref:Gamma-butyrobetaine hydroxylase-like N-terminal domain-containing protein n=1 Tax=Marchantia polymorpha subsp. ruderalis TaxID=1480154 RepID=A0A176VCQ6_MARPO|nr:hypothetical protein AXG93_436s1340 [Marchantia polymorpha subsp. ruderalis]